MAKSTAADKRHYAKVAEIGCIVCLNNMFEGTPAEIHHIGNGTMGKRGDNSKVIGLCHIHHRTGGYGIAVHAGKNEWEDNHGTELELLEQVRGLL